MREGVVSNLWKRKRGGRKGVGRRGGHDDAMELASSDTKSVCSKKRLSPEILAMLAEAESQYVAGNNAASIQILSEIAKRSPRVPVIYSMMALIYESAGITRHSLPLYSTAATLKRNNLDLWLKVVRCGLQIRDYDQALAALQRCYKLAQQLHRQRAAKRRTAMDTDTEMIYGGEEEENELDDDNDVEGDEKDDYSQPLSDSHADALHSLLRSQLSWRRRQSSREQDWSSIARLRILLLIRLRRMVAARDALRDFQLQFPADVLILGDVASACLEEHFDALAEDYFVQFLDPFLHSSRTSSTQGSGWALAEVASMRDAMEQLSLHLTPVFVATRQRVLSLLQSSISTSSKLAKHTLHMIVSLINDLFSEFRHMQQIISSTNALSFPLDLLLLLGVARLRLASTDDELDEALSVSYPVVTSILSNHAQIFSFPTVVEDGCEEEERFPALTSSEVDTAVDHELVHVLEDQCGLLYSLLLISEQTARHGLRIQTQRIQSLVFDVVDRLIHHSPPHALSAFALLSQQPLLSIYASDQTSTRMIRLFLDKFLEVAETNGHSIAKKAMHSVLRMALQQIPSDCELARLFVLSASFSSPSSSSSSPPSSSSSSSASSSAVSVSVESSVTTADDRLEVIHVLLDLAIRWYSQLESCLIAKPNKMTKPTPTALAADGTGAVSENDVFDSQEHATANETAPSVSTSASASASATSSAIELHWREAQTPVMDDHASDSDSEADEDDRKDENRDEEDEQGDEEQDAVLSEATLAATLQTHWNDDSALAVDRQGTSDGVLTLIKDMISTPNSKFPQHATGALHVFRDKKSIHRSELAHFGEVLMFLTESAREYGTKANDSDELSHTATNRLCIALMGTWLQCLSRIGKHRLKKRGTVTLAALAQLMESHQMREEESWWLSSWAQEQHRKACILIRLYCDFFCPSALITNREHLVAFGQGVMDYLQAQRLDKELSWLTETYQSALTAYDQLQTTPTSATPSAQHHTNAMDEDDQPSGSDMQHAIPQRRQRWQQAQRERFLRSAERAGVECKEIAERLTQLYSQLCDLSSSVSATAQTSVGSSPPVVAAAAVETEMIQQSNLFVHLLHEQFVHVMSGRDSNHNHIEHYRMESRWLENRLSIRDMFDSEHLRQARSVVCELLLGHEHAIFKHHIEAIDHYLNAFVMDPSQPLTSLCLAAYLVTFANHPMSKNRHDTLSKAYAFLLHYRHIRRQDSHVQSIGDTTTEKTASGEESQRRWRLLTEPAKFQETLYNFGRTFQQLCMPHLAAEQYERALRLVDDFPEHLAASTKRDQRLNVTRQCAVNLVLIYKASNARDLALAVMTKHLMIT